MKFTDKNIEVLSTTKLKALISTWIEFKLEERGLKFSLNDTYSLVHTEEEIKLNILENVKLNAGQLSFLQTYERVINDGRVTPEQMLNELNGIS